MTPSLRMAAHPGIVFRDGPTGRRAALAAGPDVWEIVALLRDLPGTVDERVTHAATQLGLTDTQVRAATRYGAAFPEEIDAEIAANEEAADRELAAWEAERRLLIEDEFTRLPEAERVRLTDAWLRSIDEDEPVDTELSMVDLLAEARDETGLT